MSEKMIKGYWQRGLGMCYGDASPTAELGIAEQDCGKGISAYENLGSGRHPAKLSAPDWPVANPGSGTLHYKPRIAGGDSTKLNAHRPPHATCIACSPKPPPQPACCHRTSGDSQPELHGAPRRLTIVHPLSERQWVCRVPRHPPLNRRGTDSAGAAYQQEAPFH